MGIYIASYKVRMASSPRVRMYPSTGEDARRGVPTVKLCETGWVDHVCLKRSDWYLTLLNMFMVSTTRCPRMLIRARCLYLLTSLTYMKGVGPVCHLTVLPAPYTTKLPLA